MGDTIYPVDGRTPIRARDMVQRYRTLDELAQAWGMTDGAVAFVRGDGLWRYDLNAEGFDFFELDILNAGPWFVADNGSVGATLAFGPTGATPSILANPANWGGPNLTYTPPLPQGANPAFMLRHGWYNPTAAPLGRLVVTSRNPAGQMVAQTGLMDAFTASINTATLAWSYPNTADTATGANTGLRTFDPGTPWANWVGHYYSGDGLSVRHFGSYWTTPNDALFPQPPEALTRPMTLEVKAQRFQVYPQPEQFELQAIRYAANYLNQATAAKAIALGGGGYAATVANAFDGTNSSWFASGQNGAANYSGGSYLGQAGIDAGLRLTAIESIAPVAAGNSSTNLPTTLALWVQAEEGGAWAHHSDFPASLNTLNAGTRYDLPFDMPYCYAWRIQPEAGLGASSDWRVGELRAFYRRADGNTRDTLQPLSAPGLWRRDIAANQGTSLARLLDYLAW